MNELEGLYERLENVRISLLGRKGGIPTLMKYLKDIPEDMRGEIGQMCNQMKRLVNDACDRAKREAEERYEEQEYGGLKICCDKCGNELKELGGILLSPPKNKIVEKNHLCIVCYNSILYNNKT